MKAKFEYYNANPYKIDCEDCTIRALSKFLNINWENAYMKLFNESIKQKVQFETSTVIRSLLDDLGYKEKDAPGKICNFNFNNKKDYIVLCKIKKHKETKYHLVCISKGFLYDTFDSSNYEIILFWEKAVQNDKTKKSTKAQ